MIEDAVTLIALGILIAGLLGCYYIGWSGHEHR